MQRIRMPTARRAALVVATALLGCQVIAPHERRLPLELEGELHVYVLAAPGDAASAGAMASLEAVGADGTAHPLGLLARDGGPRPAQALLASGRLPPGDYDGLLLGAPPGAGASVPLKLAASFTVARQRATLLTLGPRPPPGRPAGAPELTVLESSASLPRLVGACTGAAQDALTLFDTRARRATGVVPTGRSPAGVAIDERLGRAYVALAGEDQVAIVDLLTRTELGRIPLRPSDEPREVAVAQEGRLLLVVNAGSATVSLVDPLAGAEVGRLPVGSEPTSLVLDRPGRRAYVVSRGGSSVTAIDLAARAVVATVATDAEPLRARLDRAGARLLVVHARTPYLTALALPGLAPAGRALVGAGAGALEVDARSGLVYVAPAADDALLVLEPQTLQPVRRLALPGPAVDLAIDDLENVLFALVPSRRLVTATDLATGATTAAFDLADPADHLALTGARR